MAESGSHDEDIDLDSGSAESGVNKREDHDEEDSSNTNMKHQKPTRNSNGEREEEYGATSTFITTLELPSLPIYKYKSRKDPKNRGTSISRPVPILDDSLLPADFCRICHEADADEALLSPCLCRGSLSLVHRSCLERWLAEADSTVCELCGHTFRTERHPKYGMIRSVWAWLVSSDNRRERRELMFDIVSCFAFTPLVVMGTYVGFIMAENIYGTEGEDRILSQLPNRLATLSILSLMTTLDLAYVSWLVLRIQYHCSQWYSWYRRNCKVKIISMTPPMQPPPGSSQERDL